MNSLIEEILKILKQVEQVNNQVYQIEADEKAEYPFITFFIQTGYEEYSNYTDTLVVEIWDENEDTTEIEDITDEIKDILDHKIIDNEKINTVVYQDTRQNSTQSRDEVGCRELRFELQTYFK